jgi:predicted acylesterase/phospholipase RssA
VLLAYEQEKSNLRHKWSKLNNPDIEMSWWKDWKPKILCLGAGGMKGLDELGTIWWFWSENVMSDIDFYIGCSIGGILCALLSIGFWPHEILTWAIDTTLFKDASEIQMTGVAREYGLVSNSTFDDALAKRLKRMIKLKLGKIPTLAEHYRMTGKKLYLAIASLKERRVKYACCDTDPDMDLFVALRATSNMPGVFGKLEHQKDYLVDGAVMDPLPALHLDDGKTPMLAIGVLDDCPWVFEKVGAMSYFNRILAMSLQQLTEYTVANLSKACYCLLIPVSDEVGLIESSSREARMSKFLSGYNFASTYVQDRPHLVTPVVTNSLPPLSPELINSCLQSSAGKTLLRCLSENPELFETCTGLKASSLRPEVVRPLPSEPPVVRREVSPSAQTQKRPVWLTEQPQRGQMIHIPKPPVADEEDIIEIPRQPDMPFLPRQTRLPPYEFPMFRPPVGGGYQIVIHIPPEIGNLLFGMFAMTMKTLGSASNQNFRLP